VLPQNNAAQNVEAITAKTGNAKHAPPSTRLDALLLLIELPTLSSHKNELIQLP
jgi:hypothetical protein